jgi:hypothetical protein
MSKCRKTPYLFEIGSILNKSDPRFCKAFQFDAYDFLREIVPRKKKPKFDLELDLIQLASNVQV